MGTRTTTFWMALALVLTSLASAAEPAAPAARPNIVFFLADDMRFDGFGAAGNPIVQTPAIDGLAAQGCRFRNHFVTTSICCVSRASILSGQYARRHGISDFGQPFSAEAWRQTYPALLHAAGYRVALVGHLGVGQETPPDTFDVLDVHPNLRNFYTPGNPQHRTAHIGDTAVAAVDELSRKQPFCLGVQFSAPHADDGAPREFPPDARDESLYVDAAIPTPAAANDALFRALPDFVQHSEGRRRWERRFATPEMFQRTVKDYFRLISGLDREVGRVVAELAAKGLAENTIVVFSSDNGFFLGERGMADKWLMYEPSIRVPLVVVDPRLPAASRGRTAEAITLNIDLAPTLLDFAGVEVPAAMQGASLRPLLSGPADSQPAGWRTDFFYEHHTRPQILPPSEGVRGERWKYLRYVEPNPLVEELYDLTNDPDELKDLAGDPAQATTLSGLRDRWHKLAESVR